MATLKKEAKFEGLIFKSITFKEKVTKKEDLVEMVIRVIAPRLPINEAALDGVNLNSPIKAVEIGLSRVTRIVLESSEFLQQELDLVDKEREKERQAAKVKKHTRPATPKEKAEAKKGTAKATKK